PLGYELALFYDIDAHKKIPLIEDVKKLTLDDFCYLLEEPNNEVQVKVTKDRLLSRFSITFNNFDPVTGEKKTERFWLNCNQIFSYDNIHYLLTAPYSNTDRYRKLRYRLLALAKTQIGDSIKSD
ncbi:6505_t:CDS:2, partial [Funneliformis geosporum]